MRTSTLKKENKKQCWQRNIKITAHKVEQLEVKKKVCYLIYTEVTRIIHELKYAICIKSLSSIFIYKFKTKEIICTIFFKLLAFIV